jgi:ribonuclease HI
VVFHGQTTAETLEVLACREAIALARDQDVRRTKVATDCKNAVRSLEEETMGIYAHIVCEINEAWREFTEVSFCHEGRRSNKDAHSLARSVVYNDLGRSVWFLNSLTDVVCQSKFNKMRVF